MSSLVIVAIPNEDDYVWKISSEKVPHLTLLFLGEATTNPNVSKIQDFLEHAVGYLEQGPFMLDVDHRGTLGPDEADVLFFRKGWSLNRIAEFRAQLLKDNNIKAAYDSAAQFGAPQEWTPHLTLGYPETPAKPDNRDYPGISWVEFDRIALWFGNYEGPEWRLTWNDDLSEVGMSAKAGEEFISHYGVKGMKWGVRKGRDHSGANAKEVRVRQIISSSGKAKLKTKGGSGHPAHEDAVKVALSRQKLKRSGANALSNKELQDVATRLNLELQVHSLENKRPKGVGRQFVEGALKDPVKTVDTGVRGVTEVNKLLKAKR